MEIRICIDVVDMDRAIEFYTQGLGLRLGRRLRGDWTELLGGPCAIDLLCEAAGSAPLGQAHPQRRDYTRHWTPLHLDFVVTDVEAAVQRAVDEHHLAVGPPCHALRLDVERLDAQPVGRP